MAGRGLSTRIFRRLGSVAAPGRELLKARTALLLEPGAD
jgi:hypothetical protein